MKSLKWIGTVTGVMGALLIALNVGAVHWGFVFFLISSTIWCWAGYRQRDWSLASLQGAFVVINLVGLWRWLV